MRCFLYIGLFLLGVLPFELSAQQISIQKDYSFHDFQVGPVYGSLEDVSTQDMGGLLYLFVENFAASPDSIVEVILKDSFGTTHEPYGWYAWPGIMNTANDMFTAITVKGIETPLAEGAYCKVIVSSLNGALDSLEINELKTPALRLTNVVPSQDATSTYIYLRNDGVLDLEIDSIMYNGDAFLTADPEVNFSGLPIISAGEIGIIELSGTASYANAELAAIRVLYHELPSFVAHYTSAAIRTVDPNFHFGSWHSSGFDPSNEYGRKRLRNMGIQMIQGPGNIALMTDGFDRYHIRTIREPSFGDPFDVDNAIPEIRELRDSALMACWTVDDEPDLNNKDISQQVQKALTYMRYDTNTSVHINLAMQSKYQRYGFYSDIVSMDHYSAPSAPNIIPLTWAPLIGRKGEAKEAYEYMKYLKLNTEPRRNWSWVQFAAGIWMTQAEPAAVNFQFWAQVMGGSKGIKFFTATSDTEDDFSAQWNEGLSLFKEFKQIRSVALYGEPFGWTETSNEDIISESLLGPEAMTVIVVNNSLVFDGDLFAGFSTEWSEIDYSVEVFVPDWIAKEDIYMVTEIGKSYDLTVDNIAPNILRLTPDSALADRSHIFYIGPDDTQKPNQLEGLLVAEYIDSANYTLSWKETFDNIGTQAYNIYYNDSLVAKESGLVYEVKDKSLNCSAYWKVEPFDNSGNTGESDSIFFVLSGPPLAIISQPADDMVDYGGSSIIHVVPNSIVSYQWQFYNGVSWENFTESLNSIGTQSGVLELNNLYADVDVRCLMKSPCDASILSEEAAITVVDPNGIREPGIEVKVFPNPSDGIFQIYLSQAPADVQILDLQGRSRFEAHEYKSNFQLDLSHLESGLYILRISVEDGLKVHRLVKI